MHETAIPMVSMLHSCLAIHGRCKSIYHFSARTSVKFIRADIATFTDRTIWEKRIKHCKTQCEINIFHIHTNKMQLASGNPQPSPYIYIYTYIWMWMLWWCGLMYGWCYNDTTIVPVFMPWWLFFLCFPCVKEIQRWPGSRWCGPMRHHCQGFVIAKRPQSQKA